MVTKFLSACVLIASVMLVTSCGGGGGSGSTPIPGTGGIWIGTWIGPGGGEEAALALSTDIDTDTGVASFSFFLYPSRIQVAGTAQLDVDGIAITGSGTAFTIPGDSFPGGETTTGFSFTGTLREGLTFDADWTIDAGDSGSFSLDYQQEHLRSADLAKLDGIWTLYDIDDDLKQNPMGTFDILDGMIFRQTADCASTGSITIPDSRFNMYVWDATVTSNTVGSCFIEGHYTGLGVLSDTDDESPTPLNDEFDALVNSETLAFPLLLELEP